ncbi:hypothetical protein NUW58_g4063 [Xylaria curta]|uniref:Uncharacterized protein n=1 Tax=Xylaria curta TaxID=42375 RepID=A0ACC1P8Z7_9PEZI|nr:hypothetical protein NUW58_g4063 [Xylaria curta]
MGSPPRSTVAESPSAIFLWSPTTSFADLTILEKSLIATTAAIGMSPTLSIPKAKNPELQEAFENAYRWGEKCNQRLLLGIRKNKLAQESNLRRLEADKFTSKAAAYPPYRGLADRFASTDRALDDQIRVIDDEYLRELEQLVACFTTVAKPAAGSGQDPVITTLESNRQDPVIKVLEAKIDQISQLAAKQSEQIQGLLEANKKSCNSISSLETNVSSIETNHNDLKAKYNTLMSDHDALKSRSVIIDKENVALKKQLEDIQSNTEMRLGSFDTLLAELARKSADTVDSGETIKKDLEGRIAGIEAKLDDYDDVKEKLDELDLTTFNEICDAWVSSEYTLKAHHEEYSQRRRHNSSIDDTLQTLRQEVDSLRARQANDPEPGKGLGLSIQKIEEIVGAKIAAAQQSKANEDRDFLERRDEIYCDLIDGAEKRIKALEQGTPEHSKLEARIQSLEQWKVTNSASADPNGLAKLDQRVSRIENCGVGGRVDRIDLEVNGLIRKHEALRSEAAQLVQPEWVERRLQELLNSAGINDVKARVPRLEHAVKVLDSQFQNLSTKELAEYIVRLTNQAVEQRLLKLEARAKELETKTNEHDSSVKRHAEQLNSISDKLRLTVSSEKRIAPLSRLDEPSKKRKLEVNGRHPSPSQQQQQQPNNSTQPRPS